MRSTLIVIVVVLLSAALLWRRPDAASNPQFWAEDGNILFMQAQEHGLTSLWLPYAGYFHLAARTTAWMATALSVEFAPHIYALACWLLLVLLVLYIFSRRLDFRADERAVLSLALVATTTSNEVFFNIANWATLMAPWVILLATAREPRTVGDRLGDFAVLIVAGLSSPFVICLWILFAMRRWRRRTPHSAALLGLSLVVALIQIWNMGGRIAQPATGSLLNRIYSFPYRIGVVFFGDAMYRLDLDLTGRIVIFTGYALLYSIATWRAWVTRTEPAVTFFLAHAALTAMSFFVMSRWPEADFREHTGRHQYLPVLTLVWGFGCLRTAPAHWAPVGMAFAAFAFLNPSNKLEVRRDLHWRDNVVRCRNGSGTCTLPIHPITPAPQVWTVTLARP